MLLTVFMAYYAIISVYAHVHVVNGVMVVHSHPFKDKHSHPTGRRSCCITSHILIRSKPDLQPRLRRPT